MGEFPSERRQLPWYSLFRIELGQLVLLGTLLLGIGGVWFRLQANEREVADLKVTAKSKESADSDMKLVLSKLDDLRDRLDRIERQQAATSQKDSR